MTDAKAVMVDTNILLTATEVTRLRHARAQDVLQTWPRLYVSGQILREYLAVATRPASENGLGLELSLALENVQEFLGRLRFLDETRKTFQNLRELLVEIPCRGRQLHDANLVATALAHGVSAVVTENPKDFLRFHGRLTVLEL